MDLENSVAYRNSKHGDKHAVRLSVESYTDDDKFDLTLHMDVGSNIKHERVRLVIGTDDYRAVIRAMMMVDRDLTIRAFASAALED